MTQIIPFTAAIILIVLERSRRLCFRPSPLFRRSLFTDLFYLLTGFVAGGSLAVSYVVHGSWWIGDTLHLPHLAEIKLPFWLLVILALIALDVGNYLAHYLLHRFDLLWEVHKIHHSSLQLDSMATFRSHILEQIFRRLLAPFLLILVGFPSEAVVMAGGVFIAWAIFTHSNLQINLEFLEPVFITPRLHRLHHVDDSSTKNFGTVFSFWDRIRGTLILTNLSDKVQFGNGEVNYPQSWHLQFIEPFRKLIKS